MRKSLEEFIERCFKVKVHLKVSSYELHHNEDGSYADFHPQKVEDVAQLAITTQGFDTRIFCNESGLTVRMFEDYYD